MAAKKLTNAQVLEWVLDPTRKDPELVTAAVSLGTATPAGKRPVLLTELRDVLRALPAEAECAWQPRVATPPQEKTIEEPKAPAKTAWKCSNGHDVAASADFCPKCGKSRVELTTSTPAADKKSGWPEQVVDWLNKH